MVTGSQRGKYEHDDDEKGIDARPHQAGLAHQLVEEYAGGMPLDRRERLRVCF